MASSWNPFNWFGFGAFRDTLVPSIDRANLRFLIPPDARLYITRRTRKALVEHAEWLWQNFGIVKEGVAGISRHTVGKGISLQLDSEDSEWNHIAEADFEAYALTPDRCDLAGRRNFYELQTTAVEQRMIRGEFFAALTQNPEWDNEPCFQVYDSEEIGNPPHGIENGRILDGVTLNENARATGYYVKGLPGPIVGGDYVYSLIPRADMIHWFKPHSVNQTRGITELAQAVNPMVDIHELKKLATRSAKAQLLLALALKGVDKKKRRGALGAIQNAGVDSDGNADSNTSQIESTVGAAGGGIIYLDDEKGDAKLITSDMPSPLVEGFITDLLMRDVCAGWGVPSEFFWNMAKMNGGNTRFILARADIFFQIMGDRLADRVGTPIAYRYLSNRVQTGKIRACKDPNWAAKLSWQMPPRLTVDNGRENQILIELLSNGMITLREFCNARGLSYKAVMRQWVREPKEFIATAQAEGVDPEYLQRLKDNLPLWRAPKPGTVGATEGEAASPSGNEAAPQNTRKTFKLTKPDGSVIEGELNEILTNGQQPQNFDRLS
jgi:capsid protein